MTDPITEAIDRHDRALSRDLCRCGRYDGTGPHLCHGRAYTCERPGTERLYVPSWRFSLAGAQMKVSATRTIACEECWAWFVGELQRQERRERDGFAASDDVVVG